MSRPYDGRVMDQTPSMAGSVKRARERAQAGLPFDFGLKDSRGSPRRQDEAGSSPSPRTNRPQAPAGWQPTKDGQSPLSISRPQPVPQWPLGGPIASPVYSDAEPYRPPPGVSSEPPPRPQRPSKVPSMLDASRIQEHTPVFQYNPSSPSTRESESFSNLETPVTGSSSRPSTLSSVGTIPDFPVPSNQDVPQDGLRPAPQMLPQSQPQNLPPPPPLNPPPFPPRRGVVLGPPPSSRRGASSFYSTDPFVSPIPEESPRTRSYASYASSGAIPEEYPLPLPTDSPTFSPKYSPTNDHYNTVLDDVIDEDPHHDDDGDKLDLVRSASLGKRARPHLVDNKPNLERSGSQRSQARPSPQAIQQDPFEEGTAYVDSSSSSVNRDAESSNAASVGEALTADTVLKAFHKASATDPATADDVPPSPRPYNERSAIRRPPRLDMNAVRDAEARGSLTSLPDLIRRATRLATMMDKGRRPGSRFDMDFPENAYYAGQRDTVYTMDPEKRQSGLSDMLAAFPPPAQSRLSTRNSGAWLSPLPRGLSKSPRSGAWPMYAADQADPSDEQQRKSGRRCCGLPLWGFIVLLFLLITIVVTAVVVPLELLVLKQDKSAIEKCEAQLNCANGGTNVITQGVCSCICSNGFTGRDCTTPSSQGCTTTSIPSSDSTNLQDVTLGMALPQILQDAEADFSIPLSATTVLSKFNSADLSCNIQNALVTFDGESSSSADLGLTQAGEAIGQQEAVAPIGIGSSAPVVEETPVTVTVSPGLEIIIGVTDPSQLSVTTILDTYPTMTMPPPAQTTGTTTESTTEPTMQPTSAGDSYPTVPMPPSQTTSTTSTTSQPTQTTTESSTTTRPTSTKTTETSSTSSTLSTRAPVPTGDFAVTDRVVDFARVAVLFVLQEQDLAKAAQAQSVLQKFFNNASPSSGGGISKAEAQKLAIGQANSVDLINFSINLGDGQVGGSSR